MTVQTLTIRDWLPEQIANGSHGHFATRQKKLNAAQVMAWSAAKQANWQPVQGKAKLTILLVFPQRRKRDLDGLYSRVKGVVDGLRTHQPQRTSRMPRGIILPMREGWIVDDDMDHLDLHVTAEVRPGVRQTELTLEAL